MIEPRQIHNRAEHVEDERFHTERIFARTGAGSETAVSPLDKAMKLPIATSTARNSRLRTGLSPKSWMRVSCAAF